MALSVELINEFVKATNDKKDVKNETIAYGTMAEKDGQKYVKLDGSDLLTPVVMTVDALVGERVTVLIKNHTATVTGNITSPSARVQTVHTVIEETTSINKKLEATNAAIENLSADKVSVKDLQANYATIDFANINEAAIRKIYSETGIIKDIVVQDGVVTGELVGVTIKGDLIEGGTVIADKLVVKGNDGLYYKLNTDGENVETEQTEYNSLNGRVIAAKSITATKISVDDLVAFDATIGGFNITKNTLYSGEKSSVNNTTPGVYLDKTGQVAFGDAYNFVKYYQDEDGVYRLVISAENILLGSSQQSIADRIRDEVGSMDIGGRNLIRNSTTMIFDNYYFDYDETSVVGGGRLGQMLLGE